MLSEVSVGNITNSNIDYINNILIYIENKIDNDNKKINLKEETLKTDIFDPTKKSPPNDWEYRLIKRLNTLTQICI